MAIRSAWQDVHLFVSSTFRDTQAERDVLVRRVFPVLRAELLSHKIRLIDIDLRWGIEGQDESGVVAVCMEVLEQALPRFIGIIGDRYGWIPPGSAVSVTEQEITTALGYENCHPLFLFRDPARPDGSESLDFLDDSDAGEVALQKAKKLSLLRTRIEESSTARVRSYQCSIREGTVVPDAAFTIQALDGLRESLRSLYTKDDAPTEPTPSDTVGHALNFASERAAEWLSGLRGDELSHLTNFLKTNTGHIHILGEGGSGKTSLLAKALDDILDKSINDGRAVLAAFCGAHRGSESGEAVFRGFADRLVDTSIPASDDHDPSRPPSDFDGLRLWFARRITDTKAVLLIDGIDQLPERDRFLTWLPNPVPDGVTVLTGSLDTASTISLSEHWKSRATDVITLPPLDNLSGTRFVTSQLTKYRKTLSEAALSALLEKPGASTPLYLRIAAEELRTKGVRENLVNDISGMPGTAGGMFLWVLERLANDQQFRWSDGHRAVASLAGCLGIARDGLSEEELVALLSGNDAAGSDPSGDVAVLLQLLRPYLGRRGERYAPLHRVFSEALHGVGITDADHSLLGSEHPAPLDELSEVERAHAKLASLFAGSSAGNIRRLSEEAWHRIHSGDLEGACTLLTDFSVLKSRVEAGLVRGVLEDMDALLRAASDVDWPVPEELRVWQRLFRRRREFWEQFPDEFHQDCLNEAEGLPTTDSANANPIDKPWIRWVNKPEHEVRHGWEWMVRDASCAAFSLDGMNVVVGRDDGSVLLINARTGYEVWQSTGHDGWVNSAVFSVDDTLVLTASVDKTARLWDTSTGSELCVLCGHDDCVNSAVFSVDDTLVLTASDDKTARLWDASTGSELSVLSGHEASVNSARFSLDGTLVLTASADKTARLWDTSTGSELCVLCGHDGWVNSAVFSVDDTLVLTASDDKTGRLWDASTGAEIAVLRGHEAKIESAVFSLDGTRVLTASNDKTARVWDASSGVELAVLRGHDGWISYAVFSPDGTKVLTASWDMTARLWDASNGEELVVLSGHESWVHEVMFSREGNKVLTNSMDMTARLWDASNGGELAVLRGHEGSVYSVVFSPDGTRVLTTSNDKTARLWDASSGAELLVLRGHEQRVTSAVFSAGGAKVLTASFDKTARVWDASTGLELSMLRGHEESVLSAVFSPDGARVLTTSRDMTARIWDSSTGSELAVLRGHENSVGRGMFSSDGTRILTLSTDMTARLWDASTGSGLSVMPGRAGEWIYRAVFSPDGTKVLTHSGDSLWAEARIWDASSGSELLVLRGHEQRINSAVFSPDGARVLTTSRDMTARIWDSSTGSELAVLRGLEDWVRSAAFSPDGAMVITAAGGKPARIWDSLTGSELSVLDLSLLRSYEANNPPMEYPSRPTIIGADGDLRRCLRVSGVSEFITPWIDLDSPSSSDCSVNPTDPLSFVAGCADGSVRFFHLEGVELPVTH